jgi:hypothetical protein
LASAASIKPRCSREYIGGGAQQPPSAIGLRLRCCRLVVIAGGVKANARGLIDTRRGRAAEVRRLNTQSITQQ